MSQQDKKKQLKLQKKSTKIKKAIQNRNKMTTNLFITIVKKEVKKIVKTTSHKRLVRMSKHLDI